MEIRCKKCSKYLGEITKAKLVKERIFICKTCYNRFEITENSVKSKNSPTSDPFFDILGINIYK